MNTATTATDAGHWYETLTCPHCKGSGEVQFLEEWRRECETCDGFGKVHIDTCQILNAITTRKGTLYRSLPKEARLTYGAEYVWRMARFHGGADTTMPVMCFYSIGCHGILKEDAQAVLKVLDKIVDAVAKVYLGTDTAAVEAWSGLI